MSEGIKVKSVFGCQPEARVAMFHAGRCGSTVLGRMLGTNSALSWGGEVFREKKLSERHRSMVGQRGGNRRILREIELLRGPKRLYGIEIKYLPHQHIRQLKLRSAELIDLLKEADYSHFVHLTRKNLLKQVVSELVAEQNGVYHTREEIGVPNPIRISVENLFPPGSWYESAFGRNISLSKYLAYFSEHQSEMEVLLEKSSCLKLVYEADIENSPLTAYEKVCGFVGAHAEAVNVEFRKTNPFPARMLIGNYAEVQEHLRGTACEWMLND